MEQNVQRDPAADTEESGISRSETKGSVMII